MVEFLGNENVVNLIVQLVQLILVPLAGWFVVVIKNYVDEITDVEEHRRIVDTALKVIYGAVEETNQVFVDELKESGQWSKEHADEALRKAFNKTKEVLGAGGVELLEQAIGDANAFIISQIESSVRLYK